MKPDVDLHYLASLPYGAAEQELRKMGLWKEEAAAEPGKQMLYKVEVSGTYVPTVGTETVEVLATSPDEAKDRATDLTGFDAIEDVEIVSVRDFDA